MSHRRNRLVAVGAFCLASSLLAGSALAQNAYPPPSYGDAPPQGPYADAPPPVVAYPYLFGGRRFCWYDQAWNGPGWYWCGFAFRQGYGWGGAYGWNGWRRGGYAAPRGGRGGGGWRGGEHHH